MSGYNEAWLRACAAMGFTGHFESVMIQLANYIADGNLSGGGASAIGPLINGDFSVCQRTLGLTTIDQYTFDRWYLAGTSCNVSIGTFDADQTDVPGFPTNYAILERDANGAHQFINVIEGCQTYAGQTITISFYANSDAEDNEITVFWRQDFGTAGSTTVDTTPDTIVIGQGVWTRYSTTINVPSVAGKTIGPNNYSGLVIATASGQFAIGTELDIANVQIDVGSTALDWRPQDYTTSWLRCARYYLVLDGLAIQGGIAGGAFAITQTFPVPMRVAPAATVGSAAASANVSSLTVEYITTTAATPYMGTAGAGYYNDFALTLDAEITP